MSFFDKIAGIVKSPIQALGNVVSGAFNGVKALWHIGTLQWSKVPGDIGNIAKDAVKFGCNVGQTALGVVAVGAGPLGMVTAGAGAFALEAIEQKVGGGKQNLWGQTDPKAW